ncbi:MAG: hypothetical protein AB1921_08180 [Thermodesulfobacteriota bacterium]
MEHERYTELVLGDSDEGEDSSGEKLRLVLFLKEEKLRAHAVKHMTDTAEERTTWKSLGEAERRIVSRTIAALQDLACPHFTLGTAAVPCEAGRQACRLYDACTPLTEELCELYRAAIHQFIREGARVPRMARFLSDRDHNLNLTLMPDRPVVVKASQMEEDVYNVTTCYGGQDVSFARMRDMQVEMIKNEARGRNITLYTDFAWGFEKREREKEAAQQTRKDKTAAARKPAARFRGGGQSWRKYLDDDEEE